MESLREMVSGLLDIYVSSISNRLSDATKELTIISTIFIPVTFVAGVYGMNFRFMPELGSRWGYPAALGAMVLVMAGMVFYFRKRRWI